MAPTLVSDVLMSVPASAADHRRVDERSQRDVHVGAVAHHGEEQRTTDRAAGVVQVVLAPDEEGVLPVDHLELVPLDAGKRLERRTGCRATVRAVAVCGIQELVGNAIPNRAALTLSTEHASDLNQAAEASAGGALPEEGSPARTPSLRLRGSP